MVPPMEFHGTFESFNADTMLPLSSSIRAGSQHYRKGDAVEELFASEKAAMRTFSAARQFDVVRYDTCSLGNTGSVVLDGSHSYCLGPNHAREKIIAGKRAFSIEFLTRDGVLESYEKETKESRKKGTKRVNRKGYERARGNWN